MFGHRNELLAQNWLRTVELYIQFIAELHTLLNLQFHIRHIIDILVMYYEIKITDCAFAFYVCANICEAYCKVGTYKVLTPEMNLN